MSVYDFLLGLVSPTLDCSLVLLSFNQNYAQQSLTDWTVISDEALSFNHNLTVLHENQSLLGNFFSWETDW